MRFRPSPTEQLSSKLVLPRVPFTTSLFTPTPPPTTPPLSKLGRITPFCFSNSAGNRKHSPLSLVRRADLFQRVERSHSTLYFSISCTSAMLSLRSLTKRVRSC